MKKALTADDIAKKTLPELALIADIRPRQNAHPDDNDAEAKELLDAANRLQRLAMEYQAMAAQKRALLAFGYGPDHWHERPVQTF
jgi:hypothetical protein